MPNAILHVDDTPSERLRMAEVFRELGFSMRMRAKNDGCEAMQVLQQGAAEHPPIRSDILMLDVSMPRMGGFELLAFLKQHPDWRSIPVVILTHGHREHERTAPAQLRIRGFEIRPSSCEGNLALPHRLEACVSDLGRVGPSSAIS